ncbi:unnamed protein product [Arctia plantaginis]|uniref:Methyltransferase domain-containing protein n=1 Tax=Arctia plantaginis TaxID=874455 RepID=A0A8S1B1H5_ARCPL|nr:unnamed protein product [Arctia plantaginis]
MVNIVYIEAYPNKQQNQNVKEVRMPLESLITYCVYKYCSPESVSLKLISSNNVDEETSIVYISDENLDFLNIQDIPWQVASCIYPVVMYDDMIITGLCAVARHISKFMNTPPSVHVHEEGLLGFRKSCLQAPNEVSIWTKFCEVDIIKTVKAILQTTILKGVPENLVRFENHLKKPVRVHNVFKVARELKKENKNCKNTVISEDTKNLNPKSAPVSDKTRVPKTRKWKSNKNKELEIDCSIKIEDLDISHQFAEGPFLTLADIVLLPSFHIVFQSFGESECELLLPFTYKWYKNIMSIHEIEILISSICKFSFKSLTLNNVTIPTTEDVSLYKCDPKRHNPKKRLFTKEVDIENALRSITEDMELVICSNEYDFDFNWSDIPDGANPNAGHLPDERVIRKSQQLENLALSVLRLAKEGDLILDFCCGSGHLGILLAHMLPNCTVILLENKEQSLLRARLRVHEMGLKNVYFFQCNLDFFIGKFDIGIGLHACGIATDLVLDKCLKANAKFVLCPCCYGSLHATDRLVYPRSTKFSSLPVDQYLCIGHAADQTHEEHPLAVRGARCMGIIDSDRGRLAEEFGYKVTLSRLKPLSCTPKNNLLIGMPS